MNGTVLVAHTLLSSRAKPPSLRGVDVKIMKYLCVWLIHALLVMWAGPGRGEEGDTASGHGCQCPD